MSAVDWLSVALIIGCPALMIWRTHQYLNPPPLHRRPGLSMSVRKGVIHFKEHRNDPL